MKKIITLVCLLVMLSSVAQASKAKVEDVTPTTASNWHISMMPPESPEEKEEARWSLILENELGIYAYDMASLHYGLDEKKQIDKNIVDVTIKTVFTDKKLLESLDKKYASKLKKKEKTQYLIMDLAFSLKDKTYGTRGLKVYGNKGTELENSTKKLNYIPIPAESFAEAMFEICVKEAQEATATANN